jgi:hypothetical protein
MNSNVDLTDVTFGLPGNDTPFGSGEGNAPTLTGAGAITVHGTLDWESGSMAGSGQITIAPGAILNFDNPSEIAFSGRTLENQGTVYLDRLGDHKCQRSDHQRCRGVVCHAQSGHNESGGGSVSRFDNAGTLVTSTNGGATSFEASSLIITAPSIFRAELSC